MAYMLVDNLRLSCMDSNSLTVRIRYRSSAIPCTVEQQVPDGKWLIHFKEQASAVTPGQSAVFYIGNRVVFYAVKKTSELINSFLTKVLTKSSVYITGRRCSSADEDSSASQGQTISGVIEWQRKECQALT